MRLILYCFLHLLENIMIQAVCPNKSVPGWHTIDVPVHWLFRCCYVGSYIHCCPSWLYINAFLHRRNLLVLLWEVRQAAFVFFQPFGSVPPKSRVNQRWRSPRSKISWILDAWAMFPPFSLGDTWNRLHLIPHERLPSAWLSSYPFKCYE